MDPIDSESIELPVTQPIDIIYLPDGGARPPDDS
jgi:hypothetical protein